MQDAGQVWAAPEIKHLRFRAKSGVENLTGLLAKCLIVLGCQVVDLPQGVRFLSGGYNPQYSFPTGSNFPSDLNPLGL